MGKDKLMSGEVVLVLKQLYGVSTIYQQHWEYLFSPNWGSNEEQCLMRFKYFIRHGKQHPHFTAMAGNPSAYDLIIEEKDLV